MTTPPSETKAVEVQYEGPAPTFGGMDSADFFVRRRHHPSLECNLALSQDARALFASRGGALDDDGVQALLRALAERTYPRLVAEGQDIPAIILLRTADIAAGDVNALLSEAGLT